MTTEGSPTVESRRQFERLRISGVAVLAEIDESGEPTAHWRAQIVDLSRGGLGLRSKRMVATGRHLVIEAIGSAGEREKVLFGIVRQCRALDGGQHAIGVQFDRFPISPPLAAYLTRWRDRVT